MRILTIVSVCLILSFWGSSCTERPLQISEWNPDFAISLINSEFTLLDVIEELDDQDAFLVDSGQLVHLIYHGKVFSITGDQLIQLPDIDLPFLDNSTGYIPNTFPGIGSLSRIHAKTGRLRIEIQATSNNQVELLMRFPSFIKGEKVLEIDSTFILNGANVIDIDLAGYQIESTDQGFGFSIDYQGSSDLFGTISLQHLTYSYLQGRFDPITTVTKVDTVDIKLFKSQAAGVLHFRDYQLDLSIRNSIGIPINGKARVLQAKTNYEGLKDLESIELQQGIDFLYPDLQQVGQTFFTNYELNEVNSNLGEVLQAGPRELAYQFEGASLPMNKDGFIQDTSKFSVEVDIDLPLHLRADHVLLRDTFVFGLRELEEFEALEDASLRIQTENGFPAELDMQMYFLDPQGQVLDSLYESFRNVFQAAAVNAEGRVSQIEILNFDVAIPQDKLLRIANTDQVAISFETLSWNNGQTFVRMFDDYTFALRIGLRATLNQ
ncbi:MAG: hypothetical protein AAF587_38120 [Bacteroidota bacterium]